MIGVCWIMWKNIEKQERMGLLVKWVFTATSIYLLNIALGGLYVLSWTIDGYLEILSLIHLLLASTSFIILATTCIGISIVLQDIEKEQLILED